MTARTAERAPKVLIVDDGDRAVGLAHVLLREYAYATRCELPGPCWECPRREGCTLTHAHDRWEAEESLRAHPDTDVVLLDVHFDLPPERLSPGEEPLERRRRFEGLRILERVRELRPSLPVVLMTSREELQLERRREVGADELVTMAGADAFDAQALRLLIERIVSRRQGAEAEGYAWGRSMERLRRDAAVLARTSLPILITGETGTGKSALAEQVLHRASGRSGPFIVADLSAMPPTLVSSELFGTRRGAFSGAVDRPGLFQAADGGTLFLDEIGNLTSDVQRMLLTALQTGMITRLGDVTAQQVDVKLIAATHRDLRAAVRDGGFRADLYARLNPAAELYMPPLRERFGDIPTITERIVQRLFEAPADRALLQRFRQANGLRGTEVQLIFGVAKAGEGDAVVFALSEASLRALQDHRWPGNIRELELVIRSALLFALADAVAAAEGGRGGHGEARGVVPVSSRLLRDLLDRGWASEKSGRVDDEASEGTFSFEVMPQSSLRAVSRDLETQLYLRLYEDLGGRFEAMADRLLEPEIGDPKERARKVRLRFNQLGLRVRDEGRS